MNNSFSLSQAFNDGWESFKANMGIAIGAYAVMLLLYLALAFIPLIGPLASLIIGGPLVGGYLIFFLKVAENKNPELGDIFAGFSRFGQFLGMYWLMVLICILCYIPGAIVLGIGAFLSDSSEVLGIIVMILGGILMIAVIAVVGMRYCLSFFILADESGDGTVMGSLSESKRITEGVRLKLFGCMILVSIGASLGYLALLVGILFTAPLAFCVGCHIYIQLRGGNTVAVDDASPAPELTVDSE